MGGNGWKGQTVSGGTGQVLGIRHRVGRTRGHCLACPWRWTFSATERRFDGEAVDGEPREKPASERSDSHARECGQISHLVRAMGGAMPRLPCSLKLVLGREGQPQLVPSSLLGPNPLSGG